MSVAPNQQSQAQQQIQLSLSQQALIPPPSLPREEKWIVRLHGVDMGPFSTYQLYPKLLTGEIDPETMLLDQERFSRCRLREIPEFMEYLHLYNTQNPILLDEQRQQEREEFWETKGKRRVYLSIFLAIFVVVGSLVTWRVFFYKSKDVFMSDGDFLFSMQPFQASVDKKVKQRNWNYTVRRPIRKSGSAAQTKATGPSASSVDFTNDSGDSDGIPRDKLTSRIGQNIRNIFGCFKAQLERDSNFTGGEIIFHINGSSGQVTSAKLDTNQSLTVLSKCIQRQALSWSMPTFNGNAVIHYPVYVQRKTRW